MQKGKLIPRSKASQIQQENKRGTPRGNKKAKKAQNNEKDPGTPEGKDIEMAKYRRGRINDAVAKELAIALGNVREPKVINNFVSITRAEVAPDLKYATVYFSCMGDWKEAAEGLKKCTGMLRHHLAVTLNLRITPELNFVKDGSIEHGARIARILEQIKTDSTEGDDGEVAEDESAED